MNSIEKEKSIHYIKQRKINEEKYQDELHEVQHDDIIEDENEWFDYRGRED